MDIALAIEGLCPGAAYGGSTTANTREAFDTLRWEDERSQPTWEQLQGATYLEPVPEMITRRQARLALLYAGKLAAVEAAIAGIVDVTERMAAQIEYEAESWERSNQWVGQLGQATGLTAAEIDQLFITAATL
jgi:hypothetical protein